MSWKDLTEGRYIVAGSPETVRQQMEELIKSLRVGNVFCLLHVGNMPDDKVRHSTKLFAEKVMPHLRNLWPDWQNHDDRFWMPSDARTSAPSRRWRQNEIAFLTLKPHGARNQVIEAGKGRDLLFLHGAGGHLPNDPLLAALAEKYHVLAPLLPGYGESDGRGQRARHARHHAACA